MRAFHGVDALRQHIRVEALNRADQLQDRADGQHPQCELAQRAHRPAANEQR